MSKYELPFTYSHPDLSEYFTFIKNIYVFSHLKTYLIDPDRQEKDKIMIKSGVLQSNSFTNKEGKEFEDMLTRQFNKYRKEGRMYCIKVPTEVVILRRGAKIVSAFPRAKSEALDYLGILSTGECVTFEAKSSNNKTSFPLSQIKEYQFELHKEIRNYTKLL